MESKVGLPLGVTESDVRWLEGMSDAIAVLRRETPKEQVAIEALEHRVQEWCCRKIKNIVDENHGIVDMEVFSDIKCILAMSRS